MIDTVDAFAGPGGWDLPAAKLGLEVVGIELDPSAIKVRDAAQLRTIPGDVAKIDTAYLRSLGVRRVIASPPCPTWSSGSGRPGLVSLDDVQTVIAAMHRGDDLRAHAEVQDPADLLVVEPFRFAVELEPETLVCEQVPAVLPVWETTAHYLKLRGYSTWTGILNAGRYGVPQDRNRAVLIASRTRTVHRPPVLPVEVRPCDVIPSWAPSDLIGFPRRADTASTFELGGVHYRRRDLRAAAEPVFTLTGKARSWSRIDVDGVKHRVTLEEAATLQTFPADHPFGAAGSRSAAFQHLANAVPPRFALEILEAAL